MGLVTILTQPESFQFYRGKGYAYGPREVSLDAGTPNNNGVMGNGATTKPLIITPLPSIDSPQTSQTSIDSLTRGQGLSVNSITKDTERISKFLKSSQGFNFLQKEATLLLKQDIEQYGFDVTKYRSINPSSYVSNTTLAPIGNRSPNIFTFGLNPSFTREAIYGEIPTYPNRAAKTAGLNALSKGLYDTITASPMYQSSTANPDYLKDTVPFYIQKINNDGSGNNTYIHFRAYIDGLSDNYGADWTENKYMGRGEKFYSYHGFSRDISFGFSVPVLSRPEQSSVYSKLNYLASIMAPDYTEGGFMRGNLVKITIGDYITDLPGIIKGVNYGIDEEAGWDIARNERGEKEDDAYIMPKLIKISGIQFQPIHNFIPRTVSSKFITDKDGKYVDAPFITFGKKDGNSAGGYYNKDSPSFKGSSFLNAAGDLLDVGLGARNSILGFGS
jgi:hypothetical protein